MSLGIRGKLIAIFLLIKVIPLVLLAWVAWDSIKSFGDSVIAQSQTVSSQMRATITEAGELAVADTVKALDEKAREAIERLTTDIARDVARFLYERDSEITFAAQLTPDEAVYRDFLSTRKKFITDHEKWVPSADGKSWEPERKVTDDRPLRAAKVEKNKKDFHYRHRENPGLGQPEPLYYEMTFVDLTGQERVKVTTSDLMDPVKKDISQRSNTYVKAETYFSDLQKLKPGEIYVSDVIGAYRKTHMIGPYTKARAEEKSLPFDPENSGYAGKENPVGKRFKGIVRWATPVVEKGEIVGYVTLALNHDHIMEFTDHVVPTDERYSAISDAASGNYAFMWDHKARNISHPRDYFIPGYNPETGDPEVPWLSEDVYQDWQASGLTYAQYQAQAPWMKKPGEAKPEKTLIQQGRVGLDCRFLDFAPQCAGWWNLTEEGGSGSFVIFWSGLWKLTTAAAIPYHTGQYGETERGFGFITIGANVHEFHRAATETKAKLDALIADRTQKAAEQEQALFDRLEESLTQTAKDLTVYTFLMVVVVILVAVWMANVLSDRIMSLIGTLRKIEAGDLEERAEVKSKDEMGELATSLNNMTQSLQTLVAENKEAVKRAEASSEAKSNFLATMSHELRTPLNAILGLSELIKSETYGEMQPRKYMSYVSEIHNSGQMLLTLIKDILDVARLGNQEIELEETEMDVNEALKKALDMIHPVAVDKNLLIIENLDDLPSYLADSQRIEQIALNILSNACKFSDACGKIEVISGITKEGDIQVSIKDYGIGMSPEEIEHAIQPFTQVDSALSRQYEGSGLGLPLAISLLEMHGGSLSIVSEKGNGTEVIMTLPKDRIRA